jgi:hypothetical protein
MLRMIPLPLAGEERAGSFVAVVTTNVEHDSFVMY